MIDVSSYRRDCRTFTLRIHASMVGAILYRNSVYVLPYSKERLEDLQWLCQQVRDSKTEASVFVSEARDANEDKVLQALFVRKSGDEYTALLSKVERLLERIRRRSAISGSEVALQENRSRMPVFGIDFCWGGYSLEIQSGIMLAKDV